MLLAAGRWNEVSRRIELWISIQELNEQGEYSSVELHPGKDISTGGVFQLRQVRGQGRRGGGVRLFVVRLTLKQPPPRVQDGGPFISM